VAENNFGESVSTGLDLLPEMIRNDPGLEMRVGYGQLTEQQIEIAAVAAEEMNDFIEEAIWATGVANNGQLTRADAHDVQDYIYSNHAAEWAELHGSDNNGQPTAFHLVRNWGYDAELFGKGAICHVAESVYQLGFDIDGLTLQAPDGDYDQSLTVVTGYLVNLLDDDLTAGTLKNPDVIAYPEGTTGTGLDQLVNIIVADAGLPVTVPTSEIAEGARAADGMNHILVEAITETGSADDGSLDAVDMHAVNSYIRGNYLNEWIELHGDDEGDEETGFHLVQGDGATTQLYNKNAVNSVADEIYHLGFKINGLTLENEDGDPNQSINVVANYLNKLLVNELTDGSLVDETVSLPEEPNEGAGDGTGDGTGGGTGSGLDLLVEMILDDPGLQMRVGYGQLTQEEIETAADAAGEMNDIIEEAIVATGVANNGEVDLADARDIQDYIHSNYASEWAELHGSDNNGQPTAFHLVRNWGYDAELFGKGAICHVAEQVYQLGFDIDGLTLQPPEGDYGQSLNVVTGYLQNLLKDDLQAGTLKNPDVIAYQEGTTGTGLDLLVEVITTDPGLQKNLPTSEIAAGAQAADGMNHILVEAIEQTDTADDGTFDGDDMRDLNAYIRQNYLEEWTELHGDDEGDEETGFHLVQGDGGTTILFGKNAINSIADETYHLGFEINGNTLENEDGDANQSINVVANYLNQLLDEELASGYFDAVAA